MSEQLSHRQLVASVRRAAGIQEVVVRPPWAFVKMAVCHRDRTFFGYGFSKQNRYGKTADQWSEEVGVEIAKGRALADLVLAIEQAELAAAKACQSGTLVFEEGESRNIA